MDADGQPDRIGYEIFRRRGFVVRQSWHGGLEVVSAMQPVGEITVVLDEYEARDLLKGLESWRAGAGAVVGPTENR